MGCAPITGIAGLWHLPEIFPELVDGLLQDQTLSAAPYTLENPAAHLPACVVLPFSRASADGSA